jgi:replication-associated recombination protein RarA
MPAIQLSLISRVQVVEKEGLTCSTDGYEAIVFTADGDMRQALNNLQVRCSTLDRAYLQTVAACCVIV